MISPSSGSCSPASSSSSVDLPQPDGPTIATTSPSRTDSSIPSKAMVEPKRRTTPRASAASPEEKGGSLAGASSRVLNFAPFAGITPQVRRVSAGRFATEALSQPAFPRAPLLSSTAYRSPAVGEDEVAHLRLRALADQRARPLHVHL